MKKLFVCLTVLLSINAIKTTKVPVCKGIEFNGAVINPNTNKTILTIIFNFDVEKNDANQTYPNTIIFKNFEWNSSLPLKLYSMEVFEDYLNSISFDADTVSIPFRNWAIGFEFIYSYNESQQEKINIEIPYLLINDGTIVDGTTGNYFSEDNNFCFINQSASIGDSCTRTAGMKYICSGLKTCCNKIEYIEIPDFQDEICSNFQNKITIDNFPDNQYATLNFEILLSLSTDKLEASFIKQPLDFFEDFGYHYAPLNAAPSSCPPLLSNCTFPGNGRLPNNFQYLLNLHLDYRVFNDILVGELTRRNGIILKNSNVPYTRENPCWNTTGYLTNNFFKTSSNYTSSFCCIKFTSFSSTTNIASSSSLSPTEITTVTDFKESVTKTERTTDIQSTTSTKPKISNEKNVTTQSSYPTETSASTNIFSTDNLFLNVFICNLITFFIIVH